LQFLHHMLTIRRVLCPIDFSDVSRRALAHAVAIGRWFGAHLTLLHVGSPGSPPALYADVSAPDLQHLQELKDRVQTWLSGACAAGLVSDIVIGEGDPAACILKSAAGADLIVMGTHGRGGFERLVLGSVAEKVLRKANCPVMTVPPQAIATSKLPFRHVLCPVDFSESSIVALQLAFSLTHVADTGLTILHVFEWTSDEASARRVLKESEFHRQWGAETRQRLEDLIPEDVRNWCEPNPRLEYGKVYEQILRLAATGQVDLIVMGVNGRNPLDVKLFGSTTNQVVRRATCPVLTLRAPRPCRPHNSGV
jgi:nucleotide-binding universal stress UspA family protein